MREKPPGIIVLIGCTFVLSSFLIIISLFPQFTEQFGFYPGPLPFTIFSESITRILFSITLLIIAYGYISLKRWGYWIMIAYLFSSISFSYIQLIEKHPFHGDIIFMVLGLIYTLPNRKYFGVKIHSNS